MAKTKDTLKGKTILITPKLRILFEEGNYTVQKLYKNTWASESFYPNLESLCFELLETLPASSHSLTEEIKSIIEATNEAKLTILKAIKKIK